MTESAHIAPERLQAAFDRERRDARRRKAGDAREAHTHTIAMYGRLAELQRETIADERVDGACSAYDARPATCRKYYSISVDVCRHAFDAPSEPLIGDIENETVRLAGNAVALGYAKGLEDAGFDAALYELHYALHKALTDPKAERRYRDGKRAFV